MHYLYVYYKAGMDKAEAVQARVASMQAGLRQAHGVQASLQRRPEAREGLHTWMEVYHPLPAGFEAALEQAVARVGLHECVEGARRAELFMDIPPCA